MARNGGTVARLVREQASGRGSHPLLVCDHERISYLEAEQLSARLARGLIAVGAGKGTHVGLMYPNGVSFLVGTLAAARIGAVVVPFSTFATARETCEQLSAGDVEILLATATFRAHNYHRLLAEVLSDVDFESDESLASVAAPQLRHVFLEPGPLSAVRDEPGRLSAVRDIGRLYRLADTVDDGLLRALEDDVAGSDTLAIVYTSGTASAPKGVVHTHAALLNHQRNLNAIRGLGAEEKLFCNSPFFWIGGLGFALLATLAAGATLVCSNASGPAEVLDLLEAEKPTMTNGFAASIAHLARHPSFSDRDLSSMTRGNLYPIMPESARPSDPELRHNMLGMTEAGSVLLLSEDETDQPEYRRGSFGRPAPGFETMIVDPDTAEAVDVGEAGELCIRGPFVMQGYYGRSREECFDRDGWFHTGDLVCEDIDGFVYYIGRRGAMIKTAGANVSPAEVEKAIAAVSGVVSHVVGIADPERGQLVAAVLALDPGFDFDVAALCRELKTELSAYKIPKRFARLAPADVPLLASGKVDLAGLRAVFDD